MFSVLAFTALGAAGLASGCAKQEPEARPLDHAAVDRYIEQLSETVPPPAAAVLAQEDAAQDDKLSNTAAKVDRAEPVVGAVFGLAR